MEALSAEEFNAYFQAIDILESQEMLRALTVSDFPDMKKINREKLHRQLHKRAYPYQKKVAITVEDLKRMLGGVN